MGYYIQGPTIGKAAFLAREYDAEVIDCPEKFSDIPEGKALICVVSNLMFDAAGFAFDEHEFEQFKAPDHGNQRPRLWLLMNLDIAKELSGYEGGK